MRGLVHLNLDPDRRVLRQFGLIAGPGFTVLALLAWRGMAVFGWLPPGSRHTAAMILVALALYAVVAALVFPPANRPLFVGLSIVTLPIGLVVSYLALGVVYFVVLGTVATIARLGGHDPLARRRRPYESYWRRARPPRPRDDYFKRY